VALSSPPRKLRLAVGKAVKCLRDDAKMTQQQVAEESGVHSTYISHLEKGRRNPTLGTLHSVAASLGVESADILNFATVIAKRRGGSGG
jgi:transcriptional regulator with XRE-family HTH domain